MNPKILSLLISLLAIIKFTLTLTTSTNKPNFSLANFRILLNSEFVRCELDTNYSSYDNMLVLSSDSMTNSTCNYECMQKDLPFSGTMEKFFFCF
jgi:hypothetical protein